MRSSYQINITKLLASLSIATLLFTGCSDPDRPTIGLYLALQRGDIDQIERHIFWGADINKAGPNGQMPLHIAAEKGRPIVTKLLLEHGAEINAKDSKGHTPLHTAIMSGRTQVAELLIKRGAEFKVDKLLEDMVSNNLTDRDVIRLLLRNGADINHITDQGNTPLQAAIQQNNLVLVKLLIDYGADVNKPDNTGQTPLHLAKQVKNEFIIRLLVKNGAVDN